MRLVVACDACRAVIRRHVRIVSTRLCGEDIRDEQRGQIKTQ